MGSQAIAHEKRRARRRAEAPSAASAVALEPGSGTHHASRPAVGGAAPTKVREPRVVKSPGHARIGARPGRRVELADEDQRGGGGGGGAAPATNAAPHAISARIAARQPSSQRRCRSPLRVPTSFLRGKEDLPVRSSRLGRDWNDWNGSLVTMAAARGLGSATQGRTGRGAPSRSGAIGTEGERGSRANRRTAREVS